MAYGSVVGKADDLDDYPYDDRKLELHIIGNAAKEAVQLVTDYAFLARNGKEPPMHRIPGERRLQRDGDTGDYSFEVTLQVERATEPGCLALTVQITRDGKGVLTHEGSVFGCKHEHYDAMRKFARELGGIIRYVDWVKGTFTIEVYVLELAKSDCAKG